jgi:hypothetical protein
MALETTISETTLSKVFFSIFWWLLCAVFAVVAFSCFVQYHWRGAQIGEVAETHNVFRIMMCNSLRSEDPCEIVKYLGYAYAYYPAGSKFVGRNSALAPVIEQGRAQTLAVLVQHLEKITGAGFGCDLDRWTKEFGDERDIYSYESAKEYRKSQHLPVDCAMFFVCLCQPSQTPTVNYGLYHELYQ